MNYNYKYKIEKIKYIYKFKLSYDLTQIFKKGNPDLYSRNVKVELIQGKAIDHIPTSNSKYA